MTDQITQIRLISNILAHTFEYESLPLTVGDVNASSHGHIRLESAANTNRLSYAFIACNWHRHETKKHAQKRRVEDVFLHECI